MAKTAVTASEDGTARLWDVASGRQLEVMRGDEGALLSAQFSADGNSVLTTSEKGTVRLWRCNSCRPIEEIASEVRSRVGRDLDEKEKEHFGIPDPKPESH
jgi:WD40 repeat protein